MGLQTFKYFQRSVEALAAPDRSVRRRDLDQKIYTEIRKNVSEYSDTYILELLSEGKENYEPDTYNIILDEARRRSLEPGSLPKDIQIKTEIESGIQRATVFQRFIAIVIDCALMMILLFFVQKYIYFDKSINLQIKRYIILFILNFIWLARDIEGQSPGKKLVKIKVVTKKEFQRPGWIILFVRNLFLCLGIIEILGFLFDKNHERFGDKATKNIVVKA